MNRVFADSFYFFAILNPNDAAHARALAYASAHDGPIITTAWVLTELADGLAKTANRHVFAALVARLRADRENIIIPPTEALMARGIELYDSRPDKSWSLTDCISFVVMQDHGITEALTGDHHFEQARFTALLKSRVSSQPPRNLRSSLNTVRGTPVRRADQTTTPAPRARKTGRRYAPPSA
jgi:predicted nucleic acid-binding protein